MTGAKQRAEREVENLLATAWHMAAFNAATKSKQGLKPLAHYMKPKQGGGDMLAMLKTIGAGTDMKINRVKRGI